MSAFGHVCGRCGALLAPADAVCAGCGEPVPASARAALLGARAEAQAAAGQFEQAAAAVQLVLALPLEAPEAKLWWRKRGSWLRRAGRPALLDEAETAFKRSVECDDADELGHQLWMDLLQSQGRLDEARAEYGRRIKLDPGDAVAARHLASLKLMDDLRSAPPPKLDLPPPKDGFLLKILRPTPPKMLGAGVGALSCVFVLYQSWTGAGAALSLPDGAEGMGSFIKLAMDPWFNVLQIALYGAYIVWGWRSKRAS